MTYRVSMDIGGTFTDVIAFNEETGEYSAGKTSTTPEDLTKGVFAGLAQVTQDQPRSRSSSMGRPRGSTPSCSAAGEGPSAGL